MADHKLVLHPRDPEAPLPPVEVLRGGLIALGLLGPEVERFGDSHHAPGPRFAALLGLRGGRPATRLGAGGAREPVDLADVVSVELLASDEVAFLGGDVATPRCPGCGAEVDDWGERVSALYDGDDAGSVHACAGCGRASRPWELDWDGTNGFGRLAVAVWHVRDGEAAPSDELAGALAKLTATPWTSFFYRM
ncbi:MAG: hypothetical protein KC635_21780 [Myxococcales bacterium]|nr:hypothetical protein [Myxococcales bacterium]